MPEETKFPMTQLTRIEKKDDYNRGIFYADVCMKLGTSNLQSLYTWLAWYVGNHGYDDGVFPTIETLCKRTRQSKNTVTKGLQLLERNNLIKKKRRYGESTIYEVFTLTATVS